MPNTEPSTYLHTHWEHIRKLWAAQIKTKEDEDAFFGAFLTGLMVYREGLASEPHDALAAELDQMSAQMVGRLEPANTKPS